MKLKLSNSGVLKLAIFATGISGIVAEYVLATLATYFLGNQLVQWTLIISIMLFAMGVGSRISRRFSKNLLETFIILESILSLLVGFSAIVVYSVAAFSYYEGFLIYAMSISIGLLIGLEIPLVTRINEQYEVLRTNVSSILEKDYYGSLIGGVLFAFVALPYLGFSYTPIALGSLNLLVAFLMFFKLKKLVSPTLKKRLWTTNLIVLATLVLAFIFSDRIILWGDQIRYKDKVIYSEQTAYQKITLTQWKEDFWLYINHNQQLSTLDEFMYHEPLVHPVMSLTKAKNVLIIGGGDGCAARELLQYNYIEKITMVDLDPEMTRIAKENPLFTKLNDSSLWNPKVNVFNGDGKKFLESDSSLYDAIIVDLPDPKTVDLGMLYAQDFYFLANSRLRPNGVIITQAGSPYYATRAFYCIEKTIKSAGFETIPIQNQVLTLGQWGWVMGIKSQYQFEIQSKKAEWKNALKTKIKTELAASHIKTKWMTPESIDHIFSFGKPLTDTTGIEINTLTNPVLYQYYNKGNWDLY
ncbi:MAG: polyamine aminopropyltransferase [Bacteroidia bacterium]